jgi:hypothetical protein
MRACVNVCIFSLPLIPEGGNSGARRYGRCWARSFLLGPCCVKENKRLVLPVLLVLLGPSIRRHEGVM